MDGRMVEAAQTGNINLLYELIQNDPYVLERIDHVPFLDTPLHVAACAGNVDFMMEMINLKPPFVRKLNQAGLSPMHLALLSNQTQAVLQLLKFDEGLVRVKGREGLTPLHHVVQTEDVDLLIKFLEVCPAAIEDVTVRNETAFHLAIKSGMFDVFEVLVGWLIRSRHEAAQRWEKELLSCADIEGNTVLHVAVTKNTPRVIKLLLEHLYRDQINAKNLKEYTALDIQPNCKPDERQVQNQDSIADMLRKAGGLSGSSLPNKPICSIDVKKSFRTKMSCFQKVATAAGRGRKRIPYEMRYTFLVVTVLIITATYDASLNPPKKGDENDSSMKNRFQVHTNLESTDGTAPLPSPPPPSGGELVDLLGLIDVSSMFWLYNTLTFWAAIGLTAYLLPSRSICLFLLITLSLFGTCYMLLLAVSSWSFKLQYLFSLGSIPVSYHALCIINYCLSTLLALLVSYRISRYVLYRFVPKTKVVLFLVQIVSFVCFAVILVPAILNTETILKFSDFF